VKRPVAETYLKLSKALGEPSELSLRKQFCLQFLKWGFTTKKEDKEKFVELAKLWRKEESRVGRERTLLERKARKLFWPVAKHKKLSPSREGAKKHGEFQKENNIGIHGITAEERLESSRNAYRVRMEKEAHPHKREYIVYHVPSGEQFRITNLRRFCRENNLDMRNMWKTIREPGALCKGYRVERISDEWENL